MQVNKKVWILILIIVFPWILNPYFINFLKNSWTTSNSNQPNDRTNKKEKLENAGYWNLTLFPIYIDGDAPGYNARNWTWAVSQDWCSGSGVWGDPYIIENVTIEGNKTKHLIEIRDSNDYFIIRNCTLFNNQNYYHGIQLYDVENGLIINNTFDDIGWGIHLEGNCDNNTITENKFYHNSRGVYLEGGGNYCDNNTISKNYIHAPKMEAIMLHYSNYNNVTDNELDTYYYATHAGIFLNQLNRYNKILRNNMTYRGIKMNEVNEYNNISHNIMTNAPYGVYLSTILINWNTISNNTFNCVGTQIKDDYGEAINNFIYDNIEYSCPDYGNEGNDDDDEKPVINEPESILEQLTSPLGLFLISFISACTIAFIILLKKTRKANRA